MHESGAADLRRHGSGADGSLNWAAKDREWGKRKLMSGPSEEGRDESSQSMPSGTGDAHERGRGKRSEAASWLADK